METKEKAKKAKKAPAKSDGGTKKKATRKKATKAASKPRNRKHRLRPEDREKIRRRVVEHFGASKVDKALSATKNVLELQNELIRLETLMKKQVEQEEKDVEAYYKRIDDEWRNVGRPKSVFNWRECEYLCSIGCTQEEIAGFFQVKRDTLANRIKEEFGITWSEYYEKYSQGMKVAIRRKQFHVAMDGDTSMLKFLGKNYLGQKDQVDFDGQVKVNSWVDLMGKLEDEDKNDETSDEGAERE